MSVDRLADRKLVGRNDAFALVADVDKDFVVIDAYDLAGDNIAFSKVGERCFVVGNDLAVDLEEQTVAAFDDLRVSWDFRGS